MCCWCWWYVCADSDVISLPCFDPWPIQLDSRPRALVVVAALAFDPFRPSRSPSSSEVDSSLEDDDECDIRDIRDGEGGALRSAAMDSEREKPRARATAFAATLRAWASSWRAVLLGSRPSMARRMGAERGPWLWTRSGWAEHASRRATATPTLAIPFAAAGSRPSSFSSMMVLLACDEIVPGGGGGGGE